MLPRPLPVVVAAALALVPSASAHVVATTPYLDAGATTEVELEVPNERAAAMTGFHVAVPADFRVISARPNGDWLPQTTPTSVFWSGGSLPSTALTTFSVSLEAPAAPGPGTLRATQHYAGGATVRWPVELTVLPADEPSQQLGRALVVGLVGLGVLGLLAILFWRRRGNALREP